MSQASPIQIINHVTTHTAGVLSGTSAVAHGVSRKQLVTLCRSGFLTRVHPDTYRVTAVAVTDEQRARAALTWAGPTAAGWGRSAATMYRLDGIVVPEAEIVVPANRRARSRPGIHVVHCDDRASLMIRRERGIAVTGIEATLTALASCVDSEALEVACEDARRRRLTTTAALTAYLDRHGRPGRAGIAAMRALVHRLDPKHPSRSALEVKTRRLLVAHGLGDFVREFPLHWNGRTYFFDFGYAPRKVIVETNGRRWHDDPNDYEYDNEKWSVPGRHGYRIVFATWKKVTQEPDTLVAEIRATLAA